MAQTQQHDQQPEPGTGPLLRLARQGRSTREIAAELGISQSSVSRRLRQIQEARRRQFWLMTMYMVLTMSAITIAAAVATLAW
jgi:FixJ family two-component response regulator